MANWKLMKCVFNKHEYGSMLHEDIINRWIRICRHCGTIIEVDAPRDENGEPIDPHVWLRMENERIELELQKLITQMI